MNRPAVAAPANVAGAIFLFRKNLTRFDRFSRFTLRVASEAFRCSDTYA